MNTRFFFCCIVAGVLALLPSYSLQAQCLWGLRGVEQYYTEVLNIEALDSTQGLDNRGGAVSPHQAAPPPRSIVLRSDNKSNNKSDSLDAALQDKSLDVKRSQSVLNDADGFIPWKEFKYANQQLYTIDGVQPHRVTQLRPIPAIISGTAITAMVAGLQIYQGAIYWNNRATFRVIDDGDYELWADKAGHFFSAYIASRIAKDALITSGFSWDAAAVCGPLIGLGYQFYVELMDGYGRDWGFSPTDMLMNTVGASYVMAQHFLPVLQNFNIKATYYPPQWYGERSRPVASSAFDDYGAWTMWISANVHNLLPPEAQPYWPAWLNIAVGYAVRDVDLPTADRKFIVSLDYDLEKILPDGGPVWNWFRQYLNIFKFPAPAVEFSATRPPRFYLLYPFKLGAGN
jgi:hypothetical protein